MTNRKRPLEQKIQEYLDQQFASVGESQQLIDLKEELATNLREKIEDYRLKGLDDKQAFQEAIISLGDLSGLVEDMRKYEPNSQNQRPTFNQYLSAVGISAGVLMILSGLFIGAIVYFHREPMESSLGQGIFIVFGGVMLTFSLLTRETDHRPGMNKIRAGLYAVAVGLILFGIFSGVLAAVSTGQVYNGIAATFIFFIIGVAIFLMLILTGNSRRKGKV